MAPEDTHEDIVHRARKMAGNAIDEPLFQPAGASLLFAQLNSDEHQDAFDKNGLPGGTDVPDGLLGIALAAYIIGLDAAARLDGPEIDPGDNGRVLVLVGERAKRRKITNSIDDEHLGSFGGHGC